MGHMDIAKDEQPSKRRTGSIHTASTIPALRPKRGENQSHCSKDPMDCTDKIRQTIGSGRNLGMPHSSNQSIETREQTEIQAI